MTTWSLPGMASYLTMLILMLNSLSSLADSLPEYIDLSIETELEMANNLNNGDIQKLELQLKPEINVELSNDLKFTAQARIRADTQDNINPDQQSKTELREFYFEATLRDAFLTLGKQQIVWGKADGLKVLDVVNPQDFREFILDDFEDSRIPLWSLNVEIPIDESVLQLIWIPDNTYNKLPAANSIYTFTSPAIVPPIPPDVSVDLRPTEEPDHIFADADYGIRVSSFIAGWDVTFNYLYHYYDTPVLFRTLELPPQPTVTVTPHYERSHLYGATFSNAFGSFVLRGELGYSTERYFLSNNSNDINGVIKSDDLSYVLGLDWSGVENSFLSWQLFQSRLNNSDPGLVRDKVETSLSFLGRQNFLNETLIAEVLWLHNTNKKDGLVRPKLKVEWRDNINIWLGADVFYGDKNGLFGQFDQNDRFIIGLEWSL